MNAVETALRQKVGALSAAVLTATDERDAARAEVARLAAEVRSLRAQLAEVKGRLATYRREAGLPGRLRAPGKPARRAHVHWQRGLPSGRSVGRRPSHGGGVMGANSLISWTDHTFNPWIGCTRVSPGCEHCYAEGLAGSRLRRLMAPLAGPTGKLWGPTGPRRAASETTWRAPVRWNAAARRAGVPAFVFCASLADLFEDVGGHRDAAVVEAARTRLWALIAETPWLVWLLLTKRPERVAATVPAGWMAGGWPANAWIGCTVENQQRADERMPHLLALPGPARFVSYEPALEAVDFAHVDAFRSPPWPASLPGEPKTYLNVLRGEGLRPSQFGVSIETHIDNRIDWVIVGGESGPNARPFNIAWARSTLAQCREAGVPFWMKQAGAKPLGQWDPSDPAKFGAASIGRFSEGGIVVTWNFRDRAGADPAEWPEDLRVQERPEPMAVQP